MSLYFPLGLFYVLVSAPQSAYPYSRGAPTPLLPIPACVISPHSRCSRPSISPIHLHNAVYSPTLAVLGLALASRRRLVILYLACKMYTYPYRTIIHTPPTLAWPAHLPLPFALYLIRLAGLVFSAVNLHAGFDFVRRAIRISCISYPHPARVLLGPPYLHWLSTLTLVQAVSAAG